MSEVRRDQAALTYRKTIILDPPRMNHQITSGSIVSCEINKKHKKTEEIKQMSNNYLTAMKIDEQTVVFFLKPKNRGTVQTTILIVFWPLISLQFLIAVHKKNQNQKSTK